MPGQVGQFVDGEDAAIGARQQAVVHGQFVGDILPAARRLDRIDVADHIGDGDIGRGQLLHVAMVRREPGDGRVVALFLDQVAAAAADRVVRIVVDLAALDVRQHVVEQRGQHADQARFRLAAQSQQNEIVPRKNGVHDLRHHGVLIAHNARKQRRGTLQFADQVAAEFVFYGPVADTVLGECAVAKSAKSTG